MRRLESRAVHEPKLASNCDTSAEGPGMRNATRKPLLIATTNKNKVREIAAILGDLPLDLKDVVEPPVEIGGPELKPVCGADQLYRDA